MGMIVDAVVFMLIVLVFARPLAAVSRSIYRAATGLPETLLPGQDKNKEGRKSNHGK